MKNTEKMNRFVSWMKAKNMASSTIDNYKHHLQIFFKWTDEDSCRTSEKRLQDYILQIPAKFSFSYKNQAINAIKLYFKIVEHREFTDTVFPRPKNEQFIPNILTVEETKRVIFNTKNLKHRAILFTIYDNGLRISELLNLTLMDFRTKADVPHLIIRSAKHHSSRTIELRDGCIEVIKEYYKQYKPKKYLFEGEKEELQYSETSIHNIFSAALKRERIKLKIRVHDLRHSFATHCLANGMDMYQLSQVLGHKSMKTTEKYYAHLNFTQIKICRPNFSQPKELKLKIAV